MQVHIVDIQTATIVFGMLSKRISRSYKRVFKTLKESAAVHEESETIIGFTMWVDNEGLSSFFGYAAVFIYWKEIPKLVKMH
jgi:hypothetical protein